MFINLKAEQARRCMTNAIVAEKLGISRTCYESKLRTGNFRVSEAMKLCELYNCEFNYLFATKNTGQLPPASISATGPGPERQAWPSFRTARRSRTTDTTRRSAA